MTVRRTVPALLVAGLAVIAILRAHESDESSYSVRAEFENAAGLRQGQLVKISGVRVGTVGKLDVTSRDTALATLRLDDAGARVGTGAHAFVRPVNLIGEKYVDLDVGDTKRPLPSDTLIPRQRTGTPVELDDVINTLDASTRMRLAILIDQSGRALVGRGADLGATLRRLPPALDRAGALVAALARDNHALGRLVEDSDTVVGAIAGQRRALGRLVESTGGALGALAGRSRQLGATVREGPATVAQLRSTLGRLDTTARALRPAAVGLKESAPGLTATMRALPGFAAAAKPTLDAARRVAPTLTRLGREGAPVVRRLRPVAERLDEFSEALEPVSGTLDAGIGDLLGFLEGWARAIQIADGPSHMFRNQLVLSPELVTRLMNGFIKPDTSRHRARRPASATPALPGVPRVQAPKPPALPSVPRVHAPKPPALPSVPRVDAPKLPALPKDGAKPADPSDLLDFLLGP